MSIIGWFDRIFKSKNKEQEKMVENWLKIFQGNVPIFESFGKDIYMSDFVNNAIDRIATEISKLDVKSVIDAGNHVNTEYDDINRLFAFKPNPLQTTSDFLSSIEWIRRKQSNVFIYPQYEVVRYGNREYKRYIALYPLNPESIMIGVNEDGNVPLLVQFTFFDGSQYTLRYQDLIHMKWRRGTNMVLGGGNDFGKTEVRDVLQTISSLDKTIQGLPKSIEASMQINGVFNSKSLIDNKEIVKIREDFENHLATSKNGILATDLSTNFTPVNINAVDIPETTMKFLKSVIQERYGVSAAILSGDYDTTQHNAFYQTTLEDFIVQFEQVFSEALFTRRELDLGHRIRCYHNKINYMSANEKIELANIAKATGSLTLNQINEIFGFPPFEGGDKRLQSLNYVNSELVDSYQVDEEGKFNGFKKKTGEGT